LVSIDDRGAQPGQLARDETFSAADASREADNRYSPLVGRGDCLTSINLLSP